MKWPVHPLNNVRHGPLGSERELFWPLDRQHISRERDIDHRGLDTGQIDVDMNFGGRFCQVDGRRPLAVGRPQADDIERPAPLL